MRHEGAEAQRETLQRDDHQHTYVVREHPAGEWEVVRMNIPCRTSHCVVAGRGATSPKTDAEQSAELADAARRLENLRERRARLANVPAPPEDPGPFVVRRIPGFG
jgi:hypothetical protein